MKKFIIPKELILDCFYEDSPEVIDQVNKALKNKNDRNNNKGRNSKK